jgi:hypothetical protein
LEVEAGHGTHAKYARTQNTTDQGTGNTDDDRDQAAARVFARHDELGNATGDQTKQDPGEDVHGDAAGVLRADGFEIT